MAATAAAAASMLAHPEVAGGLPWVSVVVFVLVCACVFVVFVLMCLACHVVFILVFVLVPVFVSVV